MFGLYPAGSSWVRHYNAASSARQLQQDLVKHAEFTPGIFHQPFGVDRGAVIAQRDSCLVMADSTESETPELVVVPDVEMQNLLWSFNTGYANQWSERELRVLTGCNGWDALLNQAAANFAKVCADVQKGVEGALVKPVEPEKTDPVVASSFPDDDDIPWLPSEYLYDAPIPEDLSCAR